jgi:excisionase family DNA binding protein
MNEDDDGALTVQEFCALYRISRTSVYEEIKAKRLVAKKYGPRTLIPRANARDWFVALPDFEA